MEEKNEQETNIAYEMAADSSEENCVITEFIETPFSRLLFQDKLEIVQIGRPSPALPGLVQSSKRYQRHFQASSYGRYPWLTGSLRTSKLYCWEYGENVVPLFFNQIK